MRERPTRKTDLSSRNDRPLVYSIAVQGRLDSSWAEWFDGMTISNARDDAGTMITTLTGALPDQAALHGLLARIRDLSLPLERVQRLGKPHGARSPDPSEGR
jgi:hypothetical protein